jgi:hypothetical protein
LGTLRASGTLGTVEGLGDLGDLGDIGDLGDLGDVEGLGNLGDVEDLGELGKSDDLDRFRLDRLGTCTYSVQSPGQAFCVKNCTYISCSSLNFESHKNWTELAYFVT